ncbi:MAG TPA: c-type cytochrome [Chitinophagaceae bacterium]|nr:c-type cytochrome [Chitinophagaceae bacterium]
MNQNQSQDMFDNKLVKKNRRLFIILMGVILVSGIAIWVLLSRSAPLEVSSSEQISVIDSLDKPVKESLFSKYFDSNRFDVDKITDSVEKEFVVYGKKLINHTSKIIGPDVKAVAMRFSGNNLACTNCHLEGGARPYAAPFIGVWGTYPNYRGRDDILGTLENRINGCMERSMNGKPLPLDSKEMKAMLAYIKFLNEGVPVGKQVKGQGFAPMKFPNRAADLKHGKAVYTKSCMQCHGENGEGLKIGELEYLYPPLWGDDSFNDGAGMHRLLTAARFIKANMPYGTPVGEPQLSNEEAYDVAAYINSFSRPEKAHKEKDYPNLELKPPDCPYPPYADTLPIEQHRLGPYVFNQ